MESSLIKPSRRGLFSKNKNELEFNVGLEVTNKHAVFIFCGPGGEVESRFHHVLQVLKQVSFYQVDVKFPQHFKNHSLYRIGVDLTTTDLRDMFWYLSKSWPPFNASLRQRVQKSNDLFLINAMQSAYKKTNQPLPPFIPLPVKTMEHPKKHGFKSFGRT